MASDLPMPGMIPYPEMETLFLMEQVGFKFITVNGYYVTFRMPVGWKFNNMTHSTPTPEWYFLDRQNTVRFIVSGVWGPAVGYDLTVTPTTPAPTTIHSGTSSTTPARHCSLSGPFRHTFRKVY